MGERLTPEEISELERAGIQVPIVVGTFEFTDKDRALIARFHEELAKLKQKQEADNENEV